ALCETARVVEQLEQRMLLSVATSAEIGVRYPNYTIFNTAATASTTVDGYSPAQIRKAYGFDQISFGNGTIAADGSGQTIAIVDAYNDPNIAADLNVFNAQFGLPAADLTVVNQNGGSRLPSTDA